MRYAVVARNYLFKDLPEYVLYVFDGYTRREVISEVIAKGLEPVTVRFLWKWWENRLFSKYSIIEGSDYPVGFCSLQTTESSEKDE